MTRLKLLLSILGILISGMCLSQHNKVSQAAIPSWVNPVIPNYEAVVPKEAAGFYHLLVDHQDHLSTEEFYFRNTYMILNNGGIEEMGDFTIDFDPEYNEVILHHINIIRNGAVIEKLDLDKVQVFQREKNMERNLYDGRLTVLLNLTDLRIDDIIDYAYTIKGANPIYEGKYQTGFSLEFGIPLHKFNYSIYVPKGEELYYKTLQEAPEPNIIPSESHTEYSWTRSNPETIQYEPNTPAWYDPTKFIHVSQFKTWEEVSAQFQPHFSLTPFQQQELKSKVEEMLNTSEGDSLLLQKLIRFVQDDIRYLGFENGLNSHKPRAPKEVLEKRFGDCKDKSFLLSELLKVYGYEANPMLVNSFNGKKLQDLLPSPNVFDHCVVQYTSNEGEKFYVDPTISNQGGITESLYFPDYQYGLVLKQDEVALTALPSTIPSQSLVTETFDLDNIGGGAYLEVETVYKGAIADSRRQEFTSNSLQEIQKAYTDFYSLLYPDITAEVALKYEDWRDKNEFIVHEFYRIDSLWSKAEEGKSDILYAEFYPLSLEDFITHNSPSSREMPYYLSPNTEINHKTVIFTPEAWTVENEDFAIEGSHFSYNSKVRYANSKIEMIHSYKTLDDHVPANEVAEFVADHKKIQENLSYNLSYNKSFATNAQGSTSISWIGILLTIFSISLSIIGCLKIYKNYDIPNTVDKKWHKQIGGWLVVIAFGLCITPFKILFTIMKDASYYNPNTWTYIFNAETGNFFGGILIAFELLFNWALFIYVFLLLILFFQRRTILPRLIIIFYSANFIFAALDTFLALQIYEGAFSQYEIQQYYTQLMGSFIGCAIWIPYFIYSERVKDTFTKTRRPSTDVPTEENPAFSFAAENKFQEPI